LDNYKKLIFGENAHQKQQFRQRNLNYLEIIKWKTNTV